MFAIFEQFMLNFGNAVTRLCLAMGNMPIGNDFLWRIYLWKIFSRVFFSIFLANIRRCNLYIVCCQHGKLGNFVIIIIMLNLSVFIFLVCTE